MTSSAIPQSRRNIEAVLAALQIPGVVITREEEDRCFGWDTERALLLHVLMNNWSMDADGVAQQHHGAGVFASFREKTTPSMQVCFHRSENADAPYSYFVELDLDFYPPSLDPRRLLGHGFEVLGNSVTGRKTDQAKIAARLLENRAIRV